MWGQKTVRQLWGGFVLLLSIGVFVCMLVNFAVSREITWALYPAGSAVLALGIATPLFFGGKHRWLISLAALAVLIMPFLMLVEHLSSIGAWAWPVGFPIAAVSALALLLTVILFRYTHINRWYCASITVLTALPITFITNHVGSLYLNTTRNVWQTLSDIGSIVGFCALAFYFIALGRRQKKAKQA